MSQIFFYYNNQYVISKTDKSSYIEKGILFRSMEVVNMNISVSVLKSKSWDTKQCGEKEKTAAPHYKP